MRRTLSGALFVVALLGPPATDLANVLGLAARIGAFVLPEFRRGVPHAVFHMLTPIIGLALAIVILAAAIVREPYRRGEAWAWWVLAVAGLVMFLVKIWGTATIYAHHVLGGLTVELELPVLLWLAAVALSWRDFVGANPAPARR